MFKKKKKKREKKIFSPILLVGKHTYIFMYVCKWQWIDVDEANIIHPMFNDTSGCQLKWNFFFLTTTRHMFDDIHSMPRENSISTILFFTILYYYYYCYHRCDHRMCCLFVKPRQCFWLYVLLLLLLFFHLIMVVIVIMIIVIDKIALCQMLTTVLRLNVRHRIE